MSATVQFYGDWNNARTWLSAINYPGDHSEFEQSLKDLGERIKWEIQNRIDQGDASWAVLSPSTRLRKGHGMVYFESGKFRNSIEVSVNKKSRGILEIEVSPVGATDDGVPFRDIAKWLEYGTTRTPARPLWRPVMQQISGMKEFKKIHTALANSAGRALR